MTPVPLRRCPAILAALVFVLGAAPLGAQNPVPPAPRSALPRTNTSPGLLPTAIAAPEAAPLAVATPAPATTGGTAAGSDYVLTAADTVEMLVFHEPDLTTQTKIGSDGTAQFPLIGEVRIGGLAVRDARETIRRRYNADYLVEPQVYLNVVAYAGRKFTILGQVNKPGTFDFPAGEHLTLFEGVGLAGGFTRLADRGKVIIKRVSKGTEQTIKVNAKVLAAKNDKPFELVAGDVVTVGESWF